MSDLHTARPHLSAADHEASRRTLGRTIGRWMVSFAGYPLGGYAAYLLTGRVDSPSPALAGGLLTGLTLGAIQAWALGEGRSRRVAWILATGAGLSAGVASGAALVDYQTDLASLAIQGAVGGAMVGLAQAIVLRQHLGALALFWPLYLGATFALGWVVTTAVGIDVDQQFTIFGSSGALVAALLTAVLPLMLRSQETSS